MEWTDLRSSSNDLSSAPNSDAEAPTSARRTPSQPLSNTITVSNVPAAAATSSSKPTAGSTLAARQEPTQPKVRKPRKKKDSDAAAAILAVEKEKEKKPRKPRAPNGTGPASRKKVKTEKLDDGPLLHNASSTGGSASLRSEQPMYPPQGAQQEFKTEAAKFSQNGISNEQPAITSYMQPLPYSPTQQSSQAVTVAVAVSAPPVPPPAPANLFQTRSKPIFDPIRGVTIDRSTASTPVASSAAHNAPTRSTYNPSTSPAISSIIHRQETPPRPLIPTPTSSDNAPHTSDTHSMELDVPVTAQPGRDTLLAGSTAMEVDSIGQPSDRKSISEPVPSKATVKPRAKEPPPPLPTGSGLLSSTLFGGDSGPDSKQSDEKGPNIVLHVDLNDPDNRVINFARMAEQKYGFAALFPRQAAQKERLARVAAAGAALERAAMGKGGTSASGSADEDLSVDIDRESENDGDIAMSGVNGKAEFGNSGTDGPAPRKRRKRKDEYDAEDPFVDDSEMLWEAHAAASKDGFFVYCGPLVPEGEKPVVERADGTVKRGRGRGRGGGPGSRGGRGGAAASHGEGGTGRGGGPGSRGGGITRKPRITKAERQQREMEKKQREQVAVLAAKPSTSQP